MPDRVLVTGAAGYLGRHVIQTLRSQGIEATGVVRSTGPGGIRDAVACDLADASGVNSVMRSVRPSAVIHTAAWIGTGVATPETAGRSLTDNVVATANVAAGCVAAGVARLVYCSSVEVYAAAPRDGRAHREEDALEPQGLYGHTKAAGEEIVRSCKESGTESVVLRMPGLHGGGRTSGIVSRLMTAASEGKPVDLAEPDTRLSFLWVADAARVAVAVALGGTGPAAGLTLNIASGAASLGELADKAGEVAGRKIEVRRGTGQARNRVMDVSRMIDVLPFRLPPFEDGLRNLSIVEAAR